MRTSKGEGLAARDCKRTEIETYSSNTFHTQNEGVGCEIARVGHGVFLPQLAKEVLPASHVRVVDGEIAFEEEMDRAACRESVDISLLFISSPFAQEQYVFFSLYSHLRTTSSQIMSSPLYAKVSLG